MTQMAQMIRASVSIRGSDLEPLNTEIAKIAEGLAHRRDLCDQRFDPQEARNPNLETILRHPRQSVSIRGSQFEPLNTETAKIAEGLAHRRDLCDLRFSP